jgi:hypothetical protein
MLLRRDPVLRLGMYDGGDIFSTAMISTMDTQAYEEWLWWRWEGKREMPTFMIVCSHRSVAYSGGEPLKNLVTAHSYRLVCIAQHTIPHVRHRDI